MKELLRAIGFLPKDNAKGIFVKEYSQVGQYKIKVDFENRKIDYGKDIISDSAATKNFSQAENWVVLECVDRLLTKGYQPKNIVLEKTYPSGHRTSGRLDILVMKDGKAYLMIECKTWEKEFEKEFTNLKNKGGQLFTYFQQDTDAEYLVLYASRLHNEQIEYRNEIIKIEDDYKQAGNVKDLYERWNKLTKSNGLFDEWVKAYKFQSRALTKENLKDIKHTDSSFIFNRFLEILRRHVVSDKPNAFNKIFTLFLCKIVDEDRPKDEQLHFQWLEGEDDNISFQKRLTDLYKRGMSELLEKEITDLSDEEFNNRFGGVQDFYKQDFLKILTDMRLKKNNEFAFKEVFDDFSFEENAKVVKDVVELLQKYKVRYNKKHQYLGDFFELLLTTGLKQESGQFFTPVPIAKYIIKSLPFREITLRKLSSGNPSDLLPNIIDYAAGSGHFLTESMDAIQNIIENIDNSKLTQSAIRKLESWKKDQFDWAFDYVYGIEKDYRLVKTAKVSCYLHGDGLAKVIHADGLGTFNKTAAYRGKLKETDHNFTQDNKQFDIVISNPPYSVSAFKGTLDEKEAQNDFELFVRLTDQSSEIECLFVERAKQLLKDEGIAGIILPSSILSNTGIYTKTREIILKYFELIGITQLGSGTFMATGTNTVILFLRRRNNYHWENSKKSIDRFFTIFQDITVNGIENIFSKYVNYVWEGLSFSDYLSLCQKAPNSTIQQHEIFTEYNKKITVRNNEELYNQLIEIEKEKLLYFILAYGQKVVLTKTGEKKEEKQFLGYEFSNRRGHEGIHPVQRSKSIDECTKLFDPDKQDNPEKANFYIYKKFLGEDFETSEIDEAMQKNISVIGLVDMMVFDRVDFEKTLNLSVKKKIEYEDIWKTEKIFLLGEIAEIQKGNSITSSEIKAGSIPVIAGGQKPAYFHNKPNREGDIITISASGAYSGFVNYFKEPIFASDCNTIRSKDETLISTKLLYEFLKNIQPEIYSLQRGQAQPHVYGDDLATIKIPLPPKDIQEKIVNEIEEIDAKAEQEKLNKEKVNKEIEEIIARLDKYKKQEIKNLAENWDSKRKPVTQSDRKRGNIPYYGASGIVDYVKDYLINDTVLLISEDGANLKSRVTPIAFTAKGKIWVNNHAHILKFKEPATHKLVELYLNRCDLTDFITGMAQPKLSQSNLNRIKVPIPPLREQQKIIAQIEKIEQEIEKLQAEIENAKKQKEEVLKKYL